MTRRHTLIQVLPNSFLQVRFSAQALMALALRAAQFQQIGLESAQVRIESLPGEGNEISEIAGEPGDQQGSAGSGQGTSIPHLWLTGDGQVQVECSAGRQPLFSDGQPSLESLSGVTMAAAARFAEVSDPVPVLSTRHLTPDQRQRLASCEPLPGVLLLYEDEYGVMIHRDLHAEQSDGDLPDNLTQIFEWVHALRTPYVRFDCDGGEILDGLPVFDAEEALA